MSIKLGDTFPNFAVKTTYGDLKLHDWFQDSWGILFSHPADFTPVCTTELARVVQLKDEFAKRNCKVIALSCDSVESHLKWTTDIRAYAHSDDREFPYPIIADEDREIAVDLQMIDPDEKNADGLPLTARAVFIIDPKKKMRLSLLYPATTGRNFDEILRVLDSLQLCDKYKVATPADWQKGDEVMVQPSVSPEECKASFPCITIVALPSGENYVRKTAIPE
ncbi:peroxiredoxin-6 [Dendroctonus ponderosae]